MSTSLDVRMVCVKCGTMRPRYSISKTISKTCCKCGSMLVTKYVAKEVDVVNGDSILRSMLEAEDGR